MNAELLAQAIHEATGERLETHDAERVRRGWVPSSFGDLGPYKAAPFDALPAASRAEQVRSAQAAIERYEQLSKLPQGEGR